MHAVALRGQLLAPLSLGEVRILHAALSQRGCKALHSLPLIRRGGGCGKVWGWCQFVRGHMSKAPLELPHHIQFITSDFQ